MGARPRCVSAIAVGVLLGVRLGAVDFTYSFDGCPEGVIEGTPGEVKSFESCVTHTTENNEFAPEGAEDWVFFCAATGGDFSVFTGRGLAVATNRGDVTPPFDGVLFEFRAWCNTASWGKLVAPGRSIS